MSEDILAEFINNKITALSETINNQFNPSFLFEYLFPQSIDENKREISMEILPNNNIKNPEMNYVPLINVDYINKTETLLNYRKRDRIRDPLIREGFINIDEIIPKDVASQMYFASLGILGIYILYGVMKRAKMVPV